MPEFYYTTLAVEDAIRSVLGTDLAPDGGISAGWLHRLQVAMNDARVRGDVRQAHDIANAVAGTLALTGLGADVLESLPTAATSCPTPACLVSHLVLRIFINWIGGSYGALGELVDELARVPPLANEAPTFGTDILLNAAREDDAIPAPLFKRVAWQALERFLQAFAQHPVLPRRARISNSHLTLSNAALKAAHFGDRDLAWALIQAWKGKAFAEAADWCALSRLVAEEDPGFTAHAGRIERLQLRRGQLERDLLHERVGEGEPARAAVLAIQGKLDDVNTAINRLSSIIRSRGEDFPSIDTAGQQPATLEDVRAVLDPSEAFVDFAWVGDELLRFTVTNGREPELDIIDSAVVAEFDSWVRYLDQQRRRTGSWELNGEFAKSILGLGSAESNLILSPHDTFTRFTSIPFHQLVPPAQPSAIVASAGHLVHARRRESTVASDFDYVGVGYSDAGIPHAEVEVTRTGERYFSKSRTFTGRAARDFASFHAGCSLLHFACHATRDGLLLGPDDDDKSNWLVTTEADLIRVRAPVLLFTGCEVGLFTNSSGSNDFYGIVRSIMGATNAKAAIVSVDQVFDIAGPVFADLVVAALTGVEPALGWGLVSTPRGPMPVGLAVQAARLRMMSFKDSEVDGNLGGGLGRLRLQPEDAKKLAAYGWRWARPWYVLGDPTATLSGAKVTGNLSVTSPFTSPPGFGDAVRASWPLRYVQLAADRRVPFFDSQRQPSGELGGMDIFEATKRPGILRESEGRFRCWDCGRPVAGPFDTLAQAMVAMSEHLDRRSPC